MQPLGQGRQHQFTASSRTRSRWMSWVLWAGRKYCSHDESQPGQRWGELPQLGRFSAEWCVQSTCSKHSAVVWTDNLQRDVSFCQVWPKLWSSLVSRSLWFYILKPFWWRDQLAKPALQVLLGVSEIWVNEIVLWGVPSFTRPRALTTTPNENACGRRSIAEFRHAWRQPSCTLRSNASFAGALATWTRRDATLLADTGGLNAWAATE